MKPIYLCLAVFCLVNLLSCNMEKENKAIITGKTVEINDAKKLRHVVFFKFKEEASKGDIHKVEAAFAQLPAKIKEIKEFEWGLNNSPENLNKDFTHGFLLTFDNEDARDIYLPHPDHKAFGEVVGPILEDVMVFDYWTN